MNLRVANELGANYSNVSKITYKKKDKQVKHSARNLLVDARKHREDLFVKNFNLEELNYAINSIKSNKSPGGHLTFGEMIKHQEDKAKQHLLTILNISGRLANAWETSIIVPRLKPDKTATKCKNYRPVALTSITCKVMECIIHSRMINFLQKRKINFYLSAFRKHHSTKDQLFYFCQSIMASFQEKLPPPKKKKKNTTAAFLDMLSAFDRIW